METVSSEFNFEKLEVYKKAINLARGVYLTTKNFPREEIFGLTDQLRRATVSVPLNLAEGSSRTKKDFSRFIDMAKGSVFECIAVLQISLQEKYLSESEYKKLRTQFEEISRMLSGLKHSICS